MRRVVLPRDAHTAAYSFTQTPTPILARQPWEGLVMSHSEHGGREGAGGLKMTT